MSALNRDLIERSGERQTPELLRDLTFANANGIPVSNNAVGFTPGAASVSMRGFTPEATRVLIDGRRIAPYPIAAADGRMFEDLFTIQLTTIQSIEILKDGASTTYGADTAAGVINIKMWKDYRGAQLTLEYGNTLDRDAAVYQGDILFGIGDDKVQITGDVFFYHHHSLFNRDRGNSNTPPFRSTNSSPFNLQLSDAVVTAAGGTPASPTSPVGFAQALPLTNGLSPADSYVYTPSRSSFFNFDQFSGSYPEQERYGGYAAFSDKTCEDLLQIYGDFYYAKVKAHNELQPTATGSFFTPGRPTIAIPPNAPLNGVAPPNTPRFSGELGSGPSGTFIIGEVPTNVSPDAFNPFNPFNQIISGGSRGRLAEFGNRALDNCTNAFITTLGVKGDKLLDGNWGYDGAFRYSEIENDRSLTQVSASRFNRVLNAADSIFNPASTDFIGTTTPYNPFGDYRAPIASNTSLIDFATVHSKEIDLSKLTELDLNIYTTELIKLPAGSIGVAFGGQFRRESIKQDPDQSEIDNDVIGPIVPSGTSGSFVLRHGGRKQYALYAETLVPLFGPEMDVIGLHSLQVIGAFRFEEFLNNNTNALVPKVGLLWQPFDEQLTLRSTWGEGSNQPSLFQLYAEPARTVLPFFFGGVAEPESIFVIHSNRSLQPEDSRTWTGGFVYAPKLMPWGWLTLQMNLRDIERAGVAAAPSLQEVIRRSMRGGPLIPGEDVISNPVTGEVIFVRTSFQNTGRQNARGADLAVQYQLQTDVGTYTFLSDWAYLDQFIFQPTSGTIGRDRVGQASDQLSNEGWVRWKGVTRLDWTWHNFDLNATWRYVCGYREIIKPATPFNQVDVVFDNAVHEHFVHPTNFIDTQASWTLIFTPPVENEPVAGYSKSNKQVAKSKDGKDPVTTASYSIPCWKNILNNSTITIGCSNVFGQDPPKAFGYFFANGIGYPGFTYDNLGRFWYVQLTKKF